MTITIEDLRRILLDSAGRPDIDISGAGFAETTFEDMGYESLALMESAAAIEREYGVTVPDDQLVDLATPRDFVDVVNALAAESVGS